MLLGLIIGFVCLPLINGLLSVILSFFEVLKSYCGVIINRNQQKMIETGEKMPQIGFAIEEEEDYD